MMTRVVAKKKLKAGKREEFTSLYREMVELTRQEEGCITYTLNSLEGDPDIFAVIEAWRSREDLNAHLESEHFKRIIPQANEFIAEAFPLEIYEELF